MQVISANLNGIRSAANKGFFEWMLQQDADVICVQEVRAQMDTLTDEKFRPKGYYSYFFDAQKKGYSGVGIYTKKEPDRVIQGLGWGAADDEGRYIQCDFGDLSVASIYMPSGTSSEHRQEIKYDFLDRYLSILKDQIKQKRHYIICGDINIAHKKIDIKNWRSNQKNSGFLPEERAWMDTLIDTVGYVDAFRVLNQEEEQYTWWSQRGRAYANNVGWRIDYQVITPELKQKIKKVSIYKGQKFSDHAPVVVEYDLEL
jgi:exodeoxyribonuclease-3